MDLFRRVGEWLEESIDWLVAAMSMGEMPMPRPRARHANGRVVESHTQRVIPRSSGTNRVAPTVMMSLADLKELQALRSAASLRRAEEMTMIVPAISPDDTGWETYDRIGRLRGVLEGIGHVGPQYDASGRPVGDQISISLTRHEAEALIVKIGKDFAKTIGSLDPRIVNGWATCGDGS